MDKRHSTSVKETLKTILASSFPFAKKLHSVFHLLSSFVFFCVFVNALLTVPLLIYRNLYPEFIELTRYSLITSVNLIALTLFFYHGSRSTQQVPLNFTTHFPLFLVAYLGLSVQNAIAVLQGLFGSSFVFVRTPKFNASLPHNNSYLKRTFNWINAAEIFVFCYFIAGILLSIYLNDYFMMLFFVMMTYGLGFILYHSLAIVDFKNLFKFKLAGFK